jgi:hypothetical protein
MRGLTLLSLAVFLGGCHHASPPPVSERVEELAILPPGTVRYLFGGDSRNDLAHVLPWAFHEAKVRKASGFFFLGDMEITPGLDGHFESELPYLDPVPFYPVLGNHEVRVFGFLPQDHAQAEKRFRDRFLGTERTPVTSSLPGKVVYSVDVPGGLHFVALDNVSQNGFGADQLAWLAKDLEHARADPRVRFIVPGMHKPLAKNGATTHSMDSDGAQAVADSDAALALFVKYRVTIIVASHMHEFLAYVHAGIPSYITGGLGAPLSRVGDEHAFHHFLQLDLSDAGAKVAVVRFDGKPSLEMKPEVE